MTDDAHTPVEMKIDDAAFLKWNDGDTSKGYGDRQRGFLAGWEAARLHHSGQVARGWKPVPVEPTDALWEAFNYYNGDHYMGRATWEKAWTEMLAAATPPSVPLAASAPAGEEETEDRLSARAVLNSHFFWGEPEQVERAVSAMIAFRNALASPAPAAAPALPGREEIARVIDPFNWDERESYLQRADEWEAKGRPSDDVLTSGYREKADTIVAPSLAKADAILALLADRNPA